MKREWLPHCCQKEFVFALLTFSLLGCGSPSDEEESPTPLHWSPRTLSGSAAQTSQLSPLPQALHWLHTERYEVTMPVRIGNGLAQLTTLSLKGTESSEGKVLFELMHGRQDDVPRLRWEKSTLLSPASGVGEYKLAVPHFDGVPILGVSLKFQLSAQVQETVSWAVGDLPLWLSESQGPHRVSAFSLDEASARGNAAEELEFHSFRFHFLRKVYLPTKDGLQSAFEFSVSAAKEDVGRGPTVPLRVLVSADSGEILEQHPLAFHVEGSAHLFDENSVASGTKGKQDLVLPNLEGDGSRLTHKLFRVVNCFGEEPASQCAQNAQSSGGDFRGISFESPNYDELVAYYSVTKSVNWYRKLMESGGGGAWGSQKLNLGLGESSGSHLKVYVRSLSLLPQGGATPDNAQYLPSGSRGMGAPEMVIGTGWEPEQGVKRTLMYLGKDSDVFMHEFGHHVVFRAIKSVSGQSGAMHEGFADYFTYAITGNNKLGESIVKSGSPLREGSLQGSMRDYLDAPPHKAGQFWSSALWEIRAQLGPWKDGIYKFDKIVWDSIDLVKENAQYVDAITALLQATDVYSAANGEDAPSLKKRILQIFAAREYIEESSIESAANGAQVTVPNGRGAGTPAEKSTDAGKSTARRSSSSSWCGVIAATENSTVSSLAILFLPLLPLLVSGLYKAKQGQKGKVSNLPK
jgi:hypothetical protein